jgi:predicted TPR repeat methyltransferase
VPGEPTPFEKAKALHQAGRVDDAEAAYRAVPEDDPEAYKALNNLGSLLEELGRPEEAVDFYRRAIELRADVALVHYNLGRALHGLERLPEALNAYRKALEIDPDLVEALYNMASALHEQGRLDSAEAFYRRAIEIEPRLLRAHSSLGTVMFDTDRFQEAEECYRRAIEIDPNEASEHFNLGKVLDVTGRYDEAADAYRRSLEIAPESRVARENLGRLLHAMGKTEEAIDLFEKWLELNPGDPVALHMLAACTGDDVAPRASDDYVRAVFDQFAGDFELTLHRLRYRAPQLVTAALRERVGDPCSALDVLDAGCGTGLCGPLLRAFARRLVGVDLSAAMIEKARQKDVYDDLVVEELTAYLSRNAGAYDVVISADTLIYFGDLVPVFAAVGRALRPGGSLVFTVERQQGTDEPGFRLDPHGRYSHTEEYVKKSLAGAGLEVRSIAAGDLRRESGKAVEGLVVVADRGS